MFVRWVLFQWQPETLQVSRGMWLVFINSSRSIIHYVLPWQKLDDWPRACSARHGDTFCPCTVVCAQTSWAQQALQRSYKHACWPSVAVNTTIPDPFKANKSTTPHTNTHTHTHTHTNTHIRYWSRQAIWKNCLTLSPSADEWWQKRPFSFPKLAVKLILTDCDVRATNPLSNLPQF